MTENLGCRGRSTSSRTSGHSAAGTTARRPNSGCWCASPKQHQVDRLDQLTPALLDEFVASRPRSRPRSFNHLLGVVAACSTGR